MVGKEMAIARLPAILISTANSSALAAGAGVGLLGGLISLGGAEFRLPLLIGLFGFASLQP